MEIIPEDSYPVLEHLMEKMIAGTRAASVQVEVWILKPNLGPTTDFFRPLGMPKLFQRTATCSQHYSNIARR